MRRLSNSCAGSLIFGSLFLLSSVKVFFPTPFHFLFLAYCFIVFSAFVELVFLFVVFRFPSSFLTLFYSCFFGSCGFISSLPQLAWD
jgi:hypothetical protein